MHAPAQVHKGFLEQFESFTTKPESGGSRSQFDCRPVRDWPRDLHAAAAAVPSSVQPCRPCTCPAAADESNITSVLLRLSGGRTPEHILVTGHSLGGALRCVLTQAASSAAGRSPNCGCNKVHLAPAAADTHMRSELTGVWAAQVWPAVPVTVINTGAPRVGDGDWSLMFTAVIGRAFRWVQAVQARHPAGFSRAPRMQCTHVGWLPIRPRITHPCLPACCRYVNHLDKVPSLPPFDSFHQASGAVRPLPAAPCCLLLVRPRLEASGPCARDARSPLHVPAGAPRPVAARQPDAAAGGCCASVGAGPEASAQQACGPTNSNSSFPAGTAGPTAHQAGPHLG